MYWHQVEGGQVLIFFQYSISVQRPLTVWCKTNVWIYLRSLLKFLALVWKLTRQEWVKDRINLICFGGVWNISWCCVVNRVWYAPLKPWAYSKLTCPPQCGSSNSLETQHAALKQHLFLKPTSENKHNHLLNFGKTENNAHICPSVFLDFHEFKSWCCWQACLLAFNFSLQTHLRAALAC